MKELSGESTEEHCLLPSPGPQVYLAFLFSPGPLAREMVPPAVGCDVPHQLATKTAPHICNHGSNLIWEIPQLKLLSQVSRPCQDKIRTGTKPAPQLLRHETMLRGYMGINATRVKRLDSCLLVQSLKVHIPESLNPLLSQYFRLYKADLV